MARPRLYRDPIHVQMRYERALGEALPAPGRARLGWLIQRLVDSPEFQRLRHIRQNGLANLVFHGAEHSRFTHSMGVAHLAEKMYVHICRNTDLNIGEEQDNLLATCAAGLLHDIGHGPFSHTLEEILKAAGIEFNHERMTTRIIKESSIHKILSEADPALPEEVVKYISKKNRGDDHWRYKIISSQLDADRLDYLLRDANAAGLRGHAYDLERLLDMLQHSDQKRIAIHWRGVETAEGYLVALDQMYRAVYFHHSVRAASVLLSSVLRRAIMLARENPDDVLPSNSPLRDLFKEGDNVEINTYLRLGEYHIWAQIEQWQCHSDTVLADLAQRVIRRNLFKTVDLSHDYAKTDKLRNQAKEIVRKHFSITDEKLTDLYVIVDAPDRTSYKLYDWKQESPDEQIWIKTESKSIPIENYAESKIVSALKDVRYFPRLIIPAEVRNKL